jgi:hypothetical protein
MHPFISTAKWAQFRFDLLDQRERESALLLAGTSADRAVRADPCQGFVE